MPRKTIFYVSELDNKSMCLEKLSSEKNIDIVYLTLSLNDIWKYHSIRKVSPLKVQKWISDTLFNDSSMTISNLVPSICLYILVKCLLCLSRAEHSMEGCLKVVLFFMPHLIFQPLSIFSLDIAYKTTENLQRLIY